MIYTLTVLAEFCLAFAMILKPGRKVYPLFRALAIFLASKDAVLWSIRHTHTPGYFYAYYTFALIESVLLVGAVSEIVRELFFPVSILPGVTVKKMLLTVTGVTFACLITGVLFPCRYPDILLASAWTAERTSIASVCGALWLSIGFSSKLGIPWRKRLGGMIAGLTFQSSVATAALCTSPNQIAGHLIVFSGLITMGIWLYGHLSPEPALISVQQFLKLRKPCASVSLSYEIFSPAPLTERPRRSSIWAKEKQKVS